MKKLPVGIQDFKELITGNYIYIDKTRYMYDLIDSGKFYFISRPRRFGKSLTVSALYYLFRGEEKLFKGTYIHSRWNFEKHPVIKISMTELNTADETAVESSLKFRLKQLYSEYGAEIKTDDVKLLFSDLIMQLSARGKVVLLIDEYEKPILDHLQNKEKAESIRSVLRNFYQVIKDADPYLKFVFMTGITKFTKTGVFSTLNNLNEVTTAEKYSEMLGYTQDEIEISFSDYIKQLSKEKGLSRDKILENIKDYYNGFSFDGKCFVYNPFSILNYFSKKELKNYWVDSGSPSFLIDYVRANSLKPETIIGTYISETLLSNYEIEQAPPASFLVQAGYLTFKEKDPELGYLLDYPNKEVRDSFSTLLLLGTYRLNEIEHEAVRTSIIQGLRAVDFDAVFEAMKRTFANIPYNLYDNKESYYHSIILTLLWACGLDVRAEESTRMGASDLVLKYRGRVYVMELKRAPAEKALEQIRAKGYAEKYGTDDLRLVGIEIDDDNRTLKGYLME